MTVEQLTLPDAEPWRPAWPTDHEERAVLKVLNTPHGCPWTRGQIVGLTDLSDRQVRAAIERLRLAGWPIVAHSGRAGYALDWSSQGRARMLRDVEARIWSLFRVRKAIRQTGERHAA